MIGFITGKLAEKGTSIVVIEASGIGYEIESPLSTVFALPDVGQDVVLYTHMVVREDAQLLYGFHEKNDRDLFRQLIKINGVGPKLGVAILSGLSADQLVQCVEHDDVATLVKLPGIGKKTAERLLIEMRDKVKLFSSSDAKMPGVPASVVQPKVSANDEAESALIALGYKPNEAAKMVKSAASEATTVEDIIKTALRSL